MNTFCCWLRAKLDIWLGRMDNYFDVWGEDDDKESSGEDAES